MPSSGRSSPGQRAGPRRRWGGPLYLPPAQGAQALGSGTGAQTVPPGALGSGPPTRPQPQTTALPRIHRGRARVGASPAPHSHTTTPRNPHARGAGHRDGGPQTTTLPRIHRGRRGLWEEGSPSHTTPRMRTPREQKQRCADDRFSIHRDLGTRPGAAKKLPFTH